MDIINIANRQEIKEGKSIYYKIDNFGIFEIIPEIGNVPFSNIKQIKNITFVRFISFYKEKYFKNLFSLDIIKDFKIYLNINININKNCTKQINNIKKNKKINFESFLSLANRLKSDNNISNINNSSSVIKLLKEKYCYYNSFNFLKNENFKKYENILEDKNFFIYNTNIFNSLNNSYKYNNYIQKTVNFNNNNGYCDTYKIKLNNLIFHSKYIGHSNCCGFAYLHIGSIKLLNNKIDNNMLIDIYNFIFFMMYNYNKSLMLTFNCQYLSGDIKNILIKKLIKLKQCHKINDNKFLIHL